MTIMQLVTYNIALFFFALTKVPLIAFCLPKIKELTDQKLTVSIPLFWITKNHLSSMYFGALMIGADCAAGFFAFYLIKKLKQPLSIIFKDCQAQFLKRAEQRVFFICSDGEKVKHLVHKAIETKQRENDSICIKAYSANTKNNIDINAPCAIFNLTLSIKKKQE